MERDEDGADTAAGDQPPVTSRLRTGLTAAANFILTTASDALATVRSWTPLRAITIATALALFIAVTVFVDVPSIGTLRHWAEDAGGSFIVLFCLLYIGLTQFPVPRTVLTLSSGVLFGPVLGSIVALGSTTASAAISLVIVRRILGDWMRPRLTHPAVAGIDLRLRHRGWLAVGSLRMIAAIPFSILNYLTALTSVSLLSFVLATLVGSAPGTIVTVVLGDALSGGGDLRLILLSVALAGLGLVGIIVDRHLPVKADE
ncbi:TVP38/TMEM64 family protein [Corynebacterium pacaense]|uniref:TVP38/TMEM64 family protein n=1 Tax=Corynebacterium pacaense TaxID=1816684 RepID=UPI0009B9E341|nr:TVP38/TMEM64 family protein [Corynebacterium pacaense]